VVIVVVSIHARLLGLAPPLHRERNNEVPLWAAMPLINSRRCEREKQIRFRARSTSPLLPWHARAWDLISKNLNDLSLFCSDPAF